MLHMQWSMCNVFLEVSSVIGWCTVEFALWQPKPATIVFNKLQAATEWEAVPAACRPSAADSTTGLLTYC
eukprot:scaffold9480_cov71-Phaeocystis_antarctica.AAC.2